MKIERNNLCPCGSGKKHKKCCLLDLKPAQVITIVSDVQEECDDILAQIKAGDLLNAEIESERLYSLYPNDHMVNFLQGVCSIQRERYQEAISFFEKAIQMNPYFSEAYFNLANLYRKETKIPQSIACFKKIIEIEGKHGTIGRLAKRDLDWFEKMIQASSGQTLEKYLQSCTLFDEAFACLKNGDYQDAISLFQQVLTLNPDHVQSYGNMGLAHSSLGEQKMALQCLDKALLLDPTYEPAKQNRKIIIQLKEGEKISFMTEEVLYYKEKLESEGRKEEAISHF